MDNCVAAWTTHLGINLS